MNFEEFNHICQQLKPGTELVLKLNHYESGEKLNGLFLSFSKAGKYPGMMTLITKTGSVAILSEWIDELYVIPKGMKSEDIFGEQ